MNFSYQSSGQTLRWMFDAGGGPVDFTPDAAIVVDASDAAVEVLAAGGGIGLVASWIAAPYVERGLLAPVLQGFAIEGAPITAVWPASRRDNPGVKAFVAFLEEVFE